MTAALYDFAAKHAGFLGLLVLAFIVTMREDLPAPFNRVAVLNWLYAWLHDALKTFVSFRSPAPAQKRPPNQEP